MTVTCERCATTFRLDQKKIGSQGANVRCGKCGYVFFVASTTEEKRVDPPLKAETPQGGEITALGDFSSMPTQSSQDGNSKKKVVPNLTKFKAERSQDTLPRTDFVERPLSLGQRLLRFTTIILILGSGILFGLGALGVKPAPHDLFLLFRYGRPSLEEGLRVISYEGKIEDVKTETRSLRVLRVKGELFNNSEQLVGSPTLKLSLFSTSGEYLNQKIASCCSAGVAPHSNETFLMDIELNTEAQLGSYLVIIEK